jgi:hypothetical protein
VVLIHEGSGWLTAIASAAKRLRAQGDEPTYSEIVAACPLATLNPATGEAVDKALVYTVFRESCYDEDPEDKWDHRARLSRTALDEAARQRRCAFGHYMLSLNHREAWFFMKLVWCDLCNSILPRTCKKAAELKLARKGGKGWMSRASRQYSDTLRVPKNVAKLLSTDTIRVDADGPFSTRRLLSKFLGS